MVRRGAHELCVRRDQDNEHLQPDEALQLIELRQQLIESEEDMDGLLERSTLPPQQPPSPSGSARCAHAARPLADSWAAVVHHLTSQSKHEKRSTPNPKRRFQQCQLALQLRGSTSDAACVCAVSYRCDRSAVM